MPFIWIVINKIWLDGWDGALFLELSQISVEAVVHVLHPVAGRALWFFITLVKNEFISIISCFNCPFTTLLVDLKHNSGGVRNNIKVILWKQLNHQIAYLIIVRRVNFICWKTFLLLSCWCNLTDFRYRLVENFRSKKFPRFCVVRLCKANELREVHLLGFEECPSVILMYSVKLLSENDITIVVSFMDSHGVELGLVQM